MCSVTIRPGDAPCRAVANISCAGHRTTDGRPLAQIGGLVAADQLVVGPAGAWCAYRVTRAEVVILDRVGVIASRVGQASVCQRYAICTHVEF